MHAVRAVCSVEFVERDGCRLLLAAAQRHIRVRDTAQSVCRAIDALAFHHTEAQSALPDVNAISYVLNALMLHAESGGGSGGSAGSDTSGLLCDALRALINLCVNHP